MIALVVAGLCGYAIPFVKDLVARWDAPDWLKNTITLVLSALAGVLPTVAWTGVANWPTYVGNVLAALVVAVASNYLDQSKPVRHATARFGLTTKRKEHA